MINHNNGYLTTGGWTGDYDQWSPYQPNINPCPQPIVTIHPTITYDWQTNHDKKKRAPVRKLKRTMRAPVRRNKLAKSKKQTFITLVLDRSTSMGNCREAALAGVNEEIAEIKKHASKGGETFVSLILFDSVIDIVFENVPAAEVSPLELADYQMQGCTALRDAMATAIETMEGKQKKNKNQGFLVVLISDGQENVSGTTNEQLRSRIGELEGSDKWTFTYMLDGHSWEQATSFAFNTGVQIGNVSTFTSTAAGTERASGVMSGSVSSYLCSTRAGGGQSSVNFYNSGDGSESKVEG